MSFESKPRVVYLLGAGASEGALPVVSKIPAKLGEHLRWLKQRGARLNGKRQLVPGEAASDQAKLLEEYTQIIAILKRQAEAHQSIDTYAKKLFLKRSDNKADQRFADLKVGLSLFLSWVQTKQRKPDARYDGFLASVLTNGADGSVGIPKEVLILNWNYDQQLALAFNAYQLNGTLDSAMEELGMRPLELLANESSKPCRSVHLNGMFALWGESGAIEGLTPWGSRKEEDLLDALLLSYYRVRYAPGLNPNSLLLRFAWENEEDPRLEMIEGALENCEALVVIGYSFPFFNRRIDRRIIGAMESLQRIYIQAPTSSAQDIARTVRTMELPDVCKVEVYENTTTFFLPPEL